MSTNSVSILLKKVLLLFYLLCGLDLKKKISWLWLEDGSNGLHNKSLVLSLLEICCSSSPSNVLQVLWISFKSFEYFSSSSKILETKFLHSLGLLKTWCSKWEGMSSIYSNLRINSTLNWYTWKDVVDFWLAQILLRDNCKNKVWSPSPNYMES